MKWINFLHFYQPANTDAHIIREATEMSYKKIVKTLLENKKTKITANINGSLLLRWEELGYQDLINNIKKLTNSKQLELVGTVCYHPLAPLIPEKEIFKQITENENLLKKNFDIPKPRGFFLPEMAYSKEVGNTIKKAGYEWIILDEIAHNGKLNKTDTSHPYIIEDLGLGVIYRSRKYSSSYVPGLVSKKLSENKTIITATDAELYGLRHIDKTGIFENLLKNPQLKTETVSTFFDSFKDKKPTNPQSCSWESTETELNKKLPYALWKDENNLIHKKLWELAHLSYETVEKYNNDENAYWARWHMVRGFASCTFWWASNKDFSHIFGPQAWNPDEIERGVNEFIRSIRALENVATRYDKLKAERLFIEIKQLIWEKHWTDWKK